MWSPEHGTQSHDHSVLNAELLEAFQSQGFIYIYKTSLLTGSVVYFTFLAFTGVHVLSLTASDNSLV